MVFFLYNRMCFSFIFVINTYFISLAYCSCVEDYQGNISHFRSIKDENGIIRSSKNCQWYIDRQSVFHSNSCIEQSWHTPEITVNWLVALYPIHVLAASLDWLWQPWSGRNTRRWCDHAGSLCINYVVYYLRHTHESTDASAHKIK